MIVTCSRCHCSITMNVIEGPLRVCPMCGHDFAYTRVSSDTTGSSKKDIEDRIWWAEHTVKLEEEKE